MFIRQLTRGPNLFLSSCEVRSQVAQTRRSTQAHIRTNSSRMPWATQTHVHM